MILRNDLPRNMQMVDGDTVTGVDDLIRLLNADRIGRVVTFDVLRRGMLRQFDITPTERVATRSAGK